MSLLLQVLFVTVELSDSSSIPTRLLLLMLFVTFEQIVELEK